VSDLPSLTTYPHPSAPAPRIDRLVAAPPRPARLLLAFPILSGTAGLIFEILWFRDLAVIFGNTSSAAATVLAVFFFGLAAGGASWGTRAARTSNPLRLYAVLELGVAASAGVFLVLAHVYRDQFEVLFHALPRGPAIGLKALLVSLVLFPPAFFMGGTVPALAKTPGPSQAGPRARVMYALNTLGAAGGALLAGFVLPEHLGFRGSYAAAMATTGATALGALLMARALPTPASPPAPAGVALPEARFRERGVVLLAFGSGFLTLALEVVWTRLLAQFLNNSVYAFAAILVTFLLALAAGAATAHWLAERRPPLAARLEWILALSGVATLACVALLVHMTDGLRPLATAPSWWSYLRSVFVAAGILLFLPALLSGMVLPLLFRHAVGPAAAGALGRLLAINAAGAITGALVAGFVLLEVAGLWTSVAALALVYVALSALVGLRASPRRLSAAGIAAVLAVAATTMLVRRGPAVTLAQGERLVRLETGSGGTVAVTRLGDNRIMKLNNTYVLGDSRSLAVEQLQAHLPLSLHPAPHRVFLLGLGTGITAGAVLDHPVRAIVAAELLPEVVTAARLEFRPYVNGLFDDQRVRILADDGRTVLAGSRDRYDVIVSDLFTPWHAGTGSLYTLEHFRTVRARLLPGGIFAQWLPLFQMTEREFQIIARTMQDVFPQVILLRGTFSPDEPIAALVAFTEARPLDQALLLRSGARRALPAAAPAEQAVHMFGLFYAGNLAGLRPELATLPLNTDDRPVIEYAAGRSHARAATRFVGTTLDRFLARLLEALPPEVDPALAGFPKTERDYVHAGLAFYRYHLYSALGHTDSAAYFFDRVRGLTESARSMPTGR